MIPTMILFGLVFGRWWGSLVAAALLWPFMLVVSNTMDVETGLFAAAGLAVLNTAVGVLIHQGVLRIVRRRSTGPAR